jgi:hypothetical protein
LMIAAALCAASRAASRNGLVSIDLPLLAILYFNLHELAGASLTAL